MQAVPNSAKNTATKSGDPCNAQKPVAPRSNSFAALMNSAPPPAGMTPEEMLNELGELFGFSAAVVQRAADLFAELRKRNIVVEVKSPLFRDLIPRVAGGGLTAEAVSAFADSPKLLAAVELLPPDEQRRLAKDGPIQVVRRAGGEPVNMSLRAAYEEGHSSTVISGKRILTPAEQETRLRSRARPTGAGVKSSRSSLPPRIERDDDEDDRNLPDMNAAPLKAAVASDRESEQLIAKVDAEVRRRGGRVTNRELIEMVVMFGWGPIRAEASKGAA